MATVYEIVDLNTLDPVTRSIHSTHAAAIAACEEYSRRRTSEGFPPLKYADDGAEGFHDLHIVVTTLDALCPRFGYRRTNQ